MSDTPVSDPAHANEPPSPVAPRRPPVLHWRPIVPATIPRWGESGRADENLIRQLMTSGIDWFRAGEQRRLPHRSLRNPTGFEKVLKELGSEDVLSRADRQPGAQGRNPGGYLVDRKKLVAAVAH